LAAASSIVAALDALPALFAEPGERDAPARWLERLAAGFGSPGAGVVWPATDAPALEAASGQAASAGRFWRDSAGLTDELTRNGAADPAPAGGRLVAAVAAPGHRPGLLWLEARPDRRWTDDERAALALAGRLMARSPWLARSAPGAVDPHLLAQRLRDAAGVAGRLAHDFDNVLTGVMGFGELSQSAVPPGSPAREYLAELLRVVQRGIHLTQRLHQFSRGGNVNPLPAPLADLVAVEAARLRGRAQAAQLQAEVPAGLPPVALNPESLRAVLGHLLDNAAEAAPNAPVRLDARAVELTAAEAARWPGNLAAGPHVELTVTDAGPGFTPEARRRLFVELFHTTKPKHPGLGLAVAYRIVYAHRGALRVEDAIPGPGTRVRVLLPAAGAPSPTAAEPSRPATARDAVEPPAPGLSSARGAPR
jgi:signal transduction histidine kinase